jgi:predicted Zn-dependent protease
MLLKWWLLGSLLWSFGGNGQNSSGTTDDLGARAIREFRNNDWISAERDLRELLKRDPSNIYSNMYLAQSLFRQQRFSEAATFFQKTRDLQKAGKECGFRRCE